MLFTSWDGAITTEETNEFLRALSHLHTSAALESCTARDDLQRFISGGNLFAVCDYDISVGPLTPNDAYHLVQVQAFFKKRDDLEMGIDTREAAFQTFMETESNCKKTNDLFRAWSQGRLQFPPRFEAILHRAQRQIANVLGECPTFEELKPRFGPGATTQLPKRMACVKLKLSQQLACSEDMVPVLTSALESLPHLLGDNPLEDCVSVPVELHTGKLNFVRKTFKTDRVVDPAPWLNGIYQIAVGDLIADRLRKFGIDIRDQTRNRELARVGSLTGALATLDLSNASENKATGLVEHLLSPDWFYLLNCLRVGTTTYEDRPLYLQKFATQGNGFTFPLETLIFWALACSVVDDPREVSVYGDDIICPSDRADDVIYALEMAGLVVNKRKSFWSGPFRESCGGDYLSGIDIRPCFIKSNMTGHDAFRLHNFYVRRGQQSFADYVRKHIDDSIAIYGPDRYGDGHLLGDWNPRPYKRRQGFSGFLFDTFTYSKREFKRRCKGDAILPVYSIYQRDDLDDDGLERLQRGEAMFIAWLHSQDDDYNFIPYDLGRGYRFTKDGTPVNYLPGRKGLKRISIYTLGT